MLNINGNSNLNRTIGNAAYIGTKGTYASLAVSSSSNCFGPRNPTAAINTAISGNDVNWTDPTNVFSDNGSYATCTPSPTFGTTKAMDVTGFDFSTIPVGATICGIEVSFNRRVSSNASFNPRDQTVQLLLAGVASGSNYASASVWPLVQSYATYGGAADIWGLTPTLSDIQNSGFGVRIRGIKDSGLVSPTFSIDHVRIIVYYKGGLIDFPTNGVSIYRDNGTTLDPWGPIFPFTTPPTIATWFNQVAGATISTTKGGIFLTCTSGNANVNQIIGVNTTAVATPYHYAAVMLPYFTLSGVNGFGIQFYENSTGKLLSFTIFSQTTAGTAGWLALYVLRWASATSLTSAPFNVNFNTYIAPAYFLRLGHDGTNLTFDLSVDGNNWVQVYTETKTAFFTTGPDRVGIHIDNFNAVVGTNLISWTQTA